MLRKPLTPIEDDTEDAPWMVMGTPQSNAASEFYVSLREEMRVRGTPLFVAEFLPVAYYPIPGEKSEQLAPDLLVARVPIHDRQSFDVEREGVAPAFVLEVTSPWSLDRDLRIKRERYALMGVEEYAIFAPRMPDSAPLLNPPLQGYRRDPTAAEFVSWEPDEHGRLWSEVLGLWIAARNGALRAQRAEGSWVATLPEATAALRHEAEARQREAEARQRAEAERDREALARQQLEAELARLHAELERRQQDD